MAGKSNFNDEQKRFIQPFLLKCAEWKSNGKRHFCKEVLQPAWFAKYPEADEEKKKDTITVRLDIHDYLACSSHVSLPEIEVVLTESNVIHWNSIDNEGWPLTAPRRQEMVHAKAFRASCLQGAILERSGGTDQKCICRADKTGHGRRWGRKHAVDGIF